MLAYKKKKKPQRYTIRDIARMAGVSRSTVSLAINDSPLINANTKAEVLALIEKVGYRPNQAARSLVRRGTCTIGVILPKLDNVIADAYFSESLSGILDTAAGRGFHLLVEVASDAFKAEEKGLKLFRQGYVDGILCVGCLTTDDYLARLFDAGCPVVLVNSCLSSVPHVIAANRDASAAAVKHLHALGHTRIAHIKASEFVTTSIHRTEGYMSGMRDLGLECSPDLMAYGYFDQKSGYQATQWLLGLPKRPTAIFTTNDMMAIGALEAAAEVGLHVPEDLAVFGGDDIPLASYVRPPLSTFRQSMHEIGGIATEALFQQIDGKTPAPSHVIPMDLVIRESCGAKLANKPKR